MAGLTPGAGGRHGWSWSWCSGCCSRTLLSYASSQITVRAQEGLVRDLRTRLFDHLLTLDLGFFQRTRAGQVISGMITEVDQTKTVDHRLAGLAVPEPGGGGVTLVVLSQISLRLTLFTLAFVPLLVRAAPAAAPAAPAPRARPQRRSAGEVTATVTERIGAIRLIRSYGEEARESGRVQRPGRRATGSR